MPDGSSPAVHSSLETLFRAGTFAGLADGALLERFADGPPEQSEGAFAALVGRHGPMVLRVCRQVLGDPHGAEDAAQATFLVLARKARSIRRSESLASWLHGVACRVSARARAGEARRRARERRRAEMVADCAGDATPETWAELHEELGRLPEKFRVPIVLCHLEGLTYEQAAGQLRCPVRTVQSRLARGRERLRDRLIRRGIGPAASLLLAGVAADAQAAALPDAWVQSIAHTAVRQAAGGTLGAAAVKASVAELTEGVLRAMIIDKLKLASAWSVLLVGVAIAAARAAAPDATPPGQQRYRATLASGATIEVVGVSTHPSGPGTWWAPDGTPLADPPVDRVDGDVHDDDKQVRAVLVRVTGLPDGASLRWLPTYDGTYWGSSPTRDGRRVPGLEVYLATFSRDRATCEVRATVAAGPWITEAAHDGTGGTSFVKGGHKYYFGKARPYRSGTAISVAHNIVGRDNRFVAVDREGKVHTATYASGGGGEILSLLDVEFPMPPEQIREYQVQSRPFERAEIKEIALRPREGHAAAPGPRVEDQNPPTAPVAARAGQDPDSDGDGLTDYQEVHKYGTDPARFSTAGDGVSDGDWRRRREFTYTIRNVVKVMPPVNLDALNDDYQDARVLSKGPSFVELEVIHYPLNTNAAAVRGNPDWRRDAQAMGRHLRPGVTTNWDDAMRRDLIAALRADGIDPDRLDDKELVVRTTRWLLARSTYKEMFCTHYIHYPDGQPGIYPGLEAKFATDKGDPSWSTREQLERELLGRSMFANRTHGTCTSTAVYLTTVLRALGIPTRMLLAIPLVDANDPAQVNMVRDGLHHHRVRRTVLDGVAGLSGYANHTFNEVYVGGRWVRLNDNTLGQNSLDAKSMGLLTRVNTFDDLSETPLAATWGKRYALGERDEVFRTSNPYRAIDVSDHFGRYARVDNPESAAREHRAITLSRAYWADAPEADPEVRKGLGNGRDGAGHVVVHGDEWFDDQDHRQYKRFFGSAGKQFLLKADGQADVRGQLTESFITWPSRGLREMEIVIPREEYERMKPGVEYTIVPSNEKPGYEWRVKGRLAIKKP